MPNTRRAAICAMALAAILAGGTLAGGTGHAQVNSYPGTSLGGSGVQRYPSGSGSSGSAAGRAAQQRLDSAKHDTMLQSCGGMSGATADRCYSELRTTIESDRLKQQSLQSGPFREGR
jgi:type IV secretory pathway TrbL component